MLAALVFGPPDGRIIGPAAGGKLIMSISAPLVAALVKSDREIAAKAVELARNHTSPRQRRSRPSSGFGEPEPRS